MYVLSLLQLVPLPGLLQKVPQVATAQLFLGVRMQCAKCHNHPFERWSQDDYYGLSAVFARVKNRPDADAPAAAGFAPPFGCTPPLGCADAVSEAPTANKKASPIA